MIRLINRRLVLLKKEERIFRMRCYKTSVLFATMLLAASVNIVAQNTRNFSLDEAIQLSLQNGKQLKYNLAKIDEANALLKQAQNNRLPDVKASGSYMRLRSPDVNLKFGSPQAGNSLSSIKVSQVAYGIAIASLPLFSGFNIRYGIESAKYLAEAARLDADNDREALIFNAISAYSNLYKARAEVELINENLKQSQLRVVDFVNKEKNGVIIRNDLLKVQLQESNIELSLLQAQSDLKIAMVNMNLMLGLPEDAELLPDTSWLQHLNDARSFEDWKLAALQNRKDIMALQFREKSAHFNIKSAKAEYYPGIALTGNYIAADIPNFLTVTNAFGIGLGLKYNLGSLWKTDAKVAQSRAKQQQLLMNKSILNDQVRMQINEAYQAYILGLKKIEVFAKSVEQASENYNVTQIQYDNKVVTTTD
ncbi:MAG TPA: TolC family protein, partial [Cytophagaceae bacterium]|nr:TolC family protein [Cytophagaceae bacterium]